MLRTFEFRLYPTPAKAATMDSWLARLCWINNRALERRKKAYKRRKESVSLYDQFALLVEWRKRMPNFGEIPSHFCRDPLRRVDRGMKAFFRRVKSGQPPGFPRFKSRQRYNSMEALEPDNYIRGNKVRIPKLGLVTIRGHDRIPPGKQKLLRIIRRPIGWYGQVLVEVPNPKPLAPTGEAVGIDVGLINFAALSNGEMVPAPRFARWSARKLRSAQRRTSRRIKGSARRRKAVRKLVRVHERIAAQRKNFAHQLSTDLVRSFDLIALEKLNVKGMVRSRLAKSILDAAWTMLTAQLTYKAASAGRRVVFVDPRGTSQTCPSCGAVRKKSLSERAHSCPCGCQSDRDVAAAQVILARALGSSREQSPVEGGTADGGNRSHRQVRPKKREVAVAN